MRFFYVILLTFVIAFANAKKRSTCREPAVLKNFELDGILGHWYKYSSNHLDFEAGCECATFEYNAIDATNVELSTCCQMIGGSNETQTCGIGVNKIIHTGAETKDATFAFTRANSTVVSPSWIIDTDYDNFLIVNGCDQVSDDEDKDIFWILSRDKEITENEVQRINKVLKDHKFDRSKIIKQRHGVDLCTAKLPKNARKNLHPRRPHSRHRNI